MNFSEISDTISIVEYLRSLGMEPVERCHAYYKYFAPGRDEKHPSFVVYINRNDWYDFGTAKGGDIGNLVQYLYQCDASKALSILNDYALKNPFSPCSLSIPINKNEKEPGESAMQITDIREIHHWHLKSYLNERRIPLVLAEKYLKEVHYITRSGTRMHSLGFRNDNGGYVLRHKGQDKPHNIKPAYFTTIQKPASIQLNLFEGVFDFLSYLVIYKLIEPVQTSIILNSVSNLNHVLPELSKYSHVNICFDNDHAGDEATEKVSSLHESTTDYRYRYAGFKDFNEYLTSSSQPKAVSKNTFNHAQNPGRERK